MQHLESLFERALDAVVGMDAAGRVIAWNGAAEEIFGWSRDQAMGASMGELIVPPQHREAHARGLSRYLRTGEGPVLEQRVRITAMHRASREFPVELSIFPMPSEGGQRTFYAFIRSLEAEEAARQAQELRAAEASVLLAVAQRLLEDVSLEEFTRFCLDETCRVAGLKAGHLFVVRNAGAGAALVPTDIWHLSDPQFEPVRAATLDQVFARGDGLPGQAWDTGRLVALEDLTADPVFHRKAAFAAAGLTKGVAVPVRQGGETHAVLEFFGTDASRLDPELLRMLRTIGTQIGVAIRRKEAAEQREILRRELSHRVGNSLTVLASIYRSCSRQAASKEALDEAFLGRIVAMGRANRLAIEDSQQGVGLAALIREATGILPERDRIAVTAPELEIGPEAVMPLSLVLNELATNALKYGGLDEDTRLAIGATLSDDGRDLVLTWDERRVPPLPAAPGDPGRTGFGTRLIRLMVEDRLSGTLSRRLDGAGLHVEMRLPRRHL